MKHEYIACGLYIYMMIGFFLWVWAIVEDAMTGNRHRGGTIVALETLFAMLLGWPFLVVDLLKHRGRR